MENKTAQTHIEATTTRHYLRVMTFVVCGMLTTLFAALCYLFFFAKDAAAAYENVVAGTLIPYFFESNPEVGVQLHRMDGSTALPLLCAVLFSLIGLGVLQAFRDPHDSELIH